MNKKEYGDNMEKTKQKVIKFIKERYNPDKTTIEIELSDIFDFFSITEEELLNNTERFINTKNI